ncbi:MAG: M20/M25/M40 family metallo-hydrolase [Proteobacteria bacterium]|nr:M20/M25/M40 family metallo-hydrolase [Pseudomonadota bacterium]
MGGRVGGVLRAVMLAAAALGIWFLSNYESQPHWQNYAAKSATEFSALRANAMLGRILGPKEFPDPVSSDNNAAVRARIQKEFADLGVKTATYKAFTCNAWRGFSFIACATVTDIIAEVVPGEGKAIVMLAHYDSVPAGPGASDDKSGVVTVLETARALKAKNAPSKHPVIAVITDGEEAGLLGANAFLQNPALKARVGVVVNVEARGTRGQSLLFQTSPGDGKLIDLYAKSVPVMATSSLYAEIYKFLPNDTDLTLFIRQGFPSFNFAFADNVRYYHTPMDTRSNLSHATLQMHGDNMLGMVTALEQTDFASLKGGNDVYISVLGMMLPRLPESLALPFAILVFLGIALAAWLARREPFAWKPVLGAAFMPLALIVSCAAMGFITAEIAKLISGQPDPSYAYPIAMRVALGFGVFAAALLVSRMTALRGAAASAWLWMAGLGVVTAATLPGISPYFTFPSFIAAVLLLATSRTKSGWSGTVGQIALALSALAGMIVWMALVCNGETLMGLGLHELFTVPAAFALLGAIPLLAARPMTRGAWCGVTAVFAVVSLACAVVMGLQPAYSKDSPERVNILYFQKGTEAPHWIAASAWKAKGTEGIPASMMKAGGFTYDDNAYGGLNMGSAYVAPAAGTPTFQMPSATVLGDVKKDGVRTVHVAVHGSPDTSAMLFRIPKEAMLKGFAMRGQHYDPPKGWSGDTMVECSSRDCRDMDMTLTLGSTAPLTFTFAEQRYGLPAWGGKMKAARPDTAFPSQSGDGVILANSVKVP